MGDFRWSSDGKWIYLWGATELDGWKNGVVAKTKWYRLMFDNIASLTQMENTSEDAAGQIYSEQDQRVYHIQNEGGVDESLVVSNLDGTKKKRLVDRGDIDIQFDLSSDGKQIVYSSFMDFGNGYLDATMTTRLTLLQTDGTGLRVILEHQDEYTVGISSLWSYPTWSPDGKWIAFCWERREKDNDGQYHSTGEDLMIVKADGSDLTKVASLKFMECAPGWRLLPTVTTDFKKSNP